MEVYELPVQPTGPVEGWAHVPGSRYWCKGRKVKTWTGLVWELGLGPKQPPYDAKLWDTWSFEWTRTARGWEGEGSLDPLPWEVLVGLRGPLTDGVK